MTGEVMKVAGVPIGPTPLSFNALLLLGALYSLEHTACSAKDCAKCNEVMLEIYKVVGTVQDQSIPLSFQWGEGGIRIVVEDALRLAETLPAISKSVARLTQDGFDVQYAGADND